MAEAKVEYKTVVAQGWGSTPIQEFDRLVNEAMADGWKPIGGICHSYGASFGNRGRTFSIAMVRKKRKK